MRNVSEIHPYEGNPRQNENAIAAVAESIKQFGVRQPIVVDQNGVILAGHTRYYAAVSLGLESFPCHVAKDLTEKKAGLYRIADNRTAEFSAWDWEKVRAELEGLTNGVDSDETILALSAMGMSVDAWPELAVPDFESLETDTDESAGTRAPVLSVGKYKIPMTDAEEFAFVETVENYAEEFGTLFGFSRWLLAKADIEIKEEVQ